MPLMLQYDRYSCACVTAGVVWKGVAGASASRPLGLKLCMAIGVEGSGTGMALETPAPSSMGQSDGAMLMESVSGGDVAWRLFGLCAGPRRGPL